MASLAMVLLLLILGSLMLSGLQQQLRAQTALAHTESQALRDIADVDSALAWGRVQHWQSDVSVQCRQPEEGSGKLCLRIFADGSLLLIAVGVSARRWQSGERVKGAVQFSPHGWSDFCPLSEEALCLPP